MNEFSDYEIAAEEAELCASRLLQESNLWSGLDSWLAEAEQEVM